MQLTLRDTRKGHSDNLAKKSFFSRVKKDVFGAEVRIEEGRFQRWLSLMAGTSSVIAGMEVSYEHYKGSYGQEIMWTPVVLSGAMAGAGIWGFFSRWAARTVLRWTSVVTILDCIVGFFFHVRGIARKPGGWRLPVTNIVMGPPVFAPLLFGVSAYLGLIASFLRAEDSPDAIDLEPRRGRGLLGFFFGRRARWDREIRQGRFQKHLAAATFASAFFSGFEALYSHYKNNFRYKAQWSPIIIAPVLMLAAALTIKRPRFARALLPAASVAAIVDGGVGFYYHARGVARRPGGLKNPVYNILYGPPIFAPLLFAACGVLGSMVALDAPGTLMKTSEGIPGDAADRRPIDSKSGKPLPQREQPGYYPGFSTYLAQQRFWDEATRRKVNDRVYKIPPIRFFRPEEVKLMEAMAAHLLPQDDRLPARKIPIVPVIDSRLHEGKTPGYRFASMPPDEEAYRLGFQAIEQMATHFRGRPFLELSWHEQGELLKSIHDAKPKEGAGEIWKKMPIHRYWALVLQDCAEAYYAHPWAWDEIGFGGPAYPRGYMRLEKGEPEPWEVEEKRHEWEAPADCVSDPKGPDIAAHSEHPAHGQGGTH